MSHRKSLSKTGGLSPDKASYGGLSPDAIPRGEQFGDPREQDAMAGGSEASPGKRAKRPSNGMGQSFSSTKKRSVRSSVIMEEEGEEGGAHDSQRMGEPNSVDQETSSPGKRHLAPTPSDSGRARGGPPAQTSS